MIIAKEKNVKHQFIQTAIKKNSLLQVLFKKAIKKKSRMLVVVLLILTGSLYAQTIFPILNDSLLKIKLSEQINFDDLQNGDIIFQSSVGWQSEAIALATNSKYTHCGIIFKKGDDLYVYEAVLFVKLTSLDKWIKNGANGFYVVKRLKNANTILTTIVIDKMFVEGKKMRGKNYDLMFRWNDNKMYCSELVWKIYQRATGIEIGILKKTSEFDLDDKIVKKIMHKRFGNSKHMDELIISPKAIYDSELLVTIKSHIL